MYYCSLYHKGRCCIRQVIVNMLHVERSEWKKKETTVCTIRLCYSELCYSISCWGKRLLFMSPASTQCWVNTTAFTSIIWARVPLHLTYYLVSASYCVARTRCSKLVICDSKSSTQDKKRSIHVSVTLWERQKVSTMFRTTTKLILTHWFLFDKENFTYKSARLCDCDCQSGCGGLNFSCSDCSWTVVGRLEPPVRALSAYMLL